MIEEGDDDFYTMIDDQEEEAVHLDDMDEAEGSRRTRRGDGPRKQIRPRDHAAGDKRIREDYFDEQPVYNDFQFRRRCE
jgi:hypothetical protein